METYALLHRSYRKCMLKYEVEPLAGNVGRHIDEDDVEKASSRKPCGYEAGSRRRFARFGQLMLSPSPRIPHKDGFYTSIGVMPVLWGDL
jgi:hypothetical protein